MDMLTMLVFAALALTVGSLVSGIASMVSDGEVGHYGSAQWMNWRVAFQAAAIVLILLAVQAAH